MKPISELLSDVKTVMTGLTMPKAHPITTPQWSALRKVFLTHQDKELEKMLAQAELWLAEISQSLQPRWLTFCGQSGTGKTFICRELLKNCPHKFFRHPSFETAGYTCHWAKRAKDLKNQNYQSVSDDEEEALLFIDDIGAVRDSAFVSEQLYCLLEGRMGKWTLITANLDLNTIKTQMDGRIASRLIRGNNVVVECDTMDYALRKL